ncbi:hypothetical protein B0H16DRAFT_1899853, partial [Mycena metata]
MAILAPPDWTYSPRDPAMDKGPNQQSAPNNSVANQQQRPTQLPPPQHPQQYPFQLQPQGTWTRPSPHRPFTLAHSTKLAPQFHYRPPQQQPYGFDPANAQLAQWAYQQMMYAQMTPPQQQDDFFAPPPGMHMHSIRFPVGRPRRGQTSGSTPAFIPITVCRGSRATTSRCRKSRAGKNTGASNRRTRAATRPARPLLSTRKVACVPIQTTGSARPVPTSPIPRSPRQVAES